MKPLSATLAFLSSACSFAFAHFAASALAGYFAFAYGDAGTSLPRPWYASTTIGVSQILFFPLGSLDPLLEPLVQELGLWWIPLNSALVGFALAGALTFFRTRARRSKLPAAVCITVAGAFLLAALATSASTTAFEDRRQSTVGIPARITDLVLPGPELEVLPQTAKTAVVLRITRVAPHGTEFRYDLEWTGLDPGEHDLRAFLRRKDGTNTSGLPALPVTVRSVLPPGQIVPHHPPAGDVPGFGGYRTWWIVGGILWTIGLVWILLGFRRQRQRDAAVEAPPRTLAERLRPLVAYWRRKLALDDHQPAEAHVILREHAQAGPLLNQLDAWLHKPGLREEVDVGALLAPYKNLPPDAIDVPDLVARRA